MGQTYRRMERLQGGESEHLTQNYWQVRAVVLSYTTTDEELFECKQKYVGKFNREELRYLYWELAYSKAVNCKGQVALMKEYLLNEFMQRKREGVY